MLMPNKLRLTGDWLVSPIPLDADCSPERWVFAAWRAVPECCHLQPAFYPEQPYWGEHLRAINKSAWVYQRHITVPDVPFERARLRFEGVDYYASVWLNNQFLGQHEGNFAPFTFDVTRHLRRDQKNILTVRVSAPWDAANPAGNYPIDHVLRGLVKGLYEHGEGVIPPDVNPIGIWRPVWLILDSGISLERASIWATADGVADIAVTVSNQTGRAWQGTLSITLRPENHAGHEVSQALPVSIGPGQQVVKTSLQVPDPCLWWPWDQGFPALYCLHALLREESQQPSDALTETFGFRSVSLERAPDRFVYLVNGRPVFLRGVSYIPGLYLSECDAAWLERDLRSVRSLNLNLLRVHVHVSPPLLYDLCDRAGIMVWQDFELNWVHDPSPDFEQRARALQHDMIDLLGNHPSIITWACHNEPTMVFSRRANLEQRPDPSLYADACQQDPTRPVFLCSGQMESDWRRSGDVHSYYGALWTARYTDVYRHTCRLNTEFGFEAPAALTTLQRYPECWERLKHLETQIEALWAYQAQLIQFHVEHFRRQRGHSCAGYILFWLADLVPQVGCGILDACRQPKGGYGALRMASQPLHIALEHDGHRPRAWWVFNDTPDDHPDAMAVCQILDRENRLRFEARKSICVAANRSHRIGSARWPVPAAQCYRIELELRSGDGAVLACNHYDQPFQPLRRPKGYPWKFDPFLGCKVFDLPGAPSLADQSGNSLLKFIPLTMRERTAEWVLRQRLPPYLLSWLAHVVDVVNR